MNIKQFKVGIAVVLILGTVTLFVVFPALSQGPALPPGEYDLEAGQYVFNEPDGDVLSLDLAPVVATDTPAPTDTPVPATATPVPPAHDPEAYHALTQEFAHTHHYDPSRFDAIFGPVGALYGGQEISYPWETLNENLNKHTGYKWEVRDINDPELTALGIPNGCSIQNFLNPLCITKWRIQYHSIGGSRALAGFLHSFLAELEVCTQDLLQCGTVKTGGFNNFGLLVVPYQGDYIPLPGDPPEFATQNVNLNPYRAHRADNDPSGEDCHINSPLGECRYLWITNRDAIYGYNEMFSMAFRVKDDWQGVNLADPLLENPVCPDGSCGLNHSNHFLFQMYLSLDQFFPQFTGQPTIDFSGFTDRFGNIVPSCAPLGADCIPLELVGVPNPLENGNQKWASFNADAGVTGGPWVFDFEHDISPPGESWIVYPYELP